MVAGTMAKSDEELLIAYGRAGDRAALEELVRRRWADAFRLALRLAGDAAAAEDVAQEAFCRVVRAASSFREGSAFGPWFRTIVLNAARTSRSEARTRRRHEEGLARRTERVAEDVEGERTLASEELSRHLAQLPEKLREPLVLHFFEGCTYEEAAALLGAPKPTIQSRIRSGLDELRRSLAGAGAAAGAAWSLVELEACLGREARRAVAAPPAPSVALLEAGAKQVAMGGLGAAAAKLGVALAALGVAALGVRSLVAPPPVSSTPGGTVAIASQSGPDLAARRPADPAAVASSPEPVAAPSAPETGARPRAAASGERTRARVAGRVVGDDGRPIRSRAYVSLTRLSDRSPNVSTTGDDGSFAFAEVEDGAYVLEARARGFGLASVPVHLDGEHPRVEGLDLRLGLGPVVVGRLVDEAGHPYAGAQLDLVDADAERVGECSVADDGSFEIRGVRPGAVAVSVTLPNTFRSVEPDTGSSAVVPPDGRVSLGDVVLRARRSSLTFAVFGRDGQPVKGASITLGGCIPSRTETHYDEVASTAAGLEAGRYVVLAGKDGGVSAPVTVDLAAGEARRVDLTLGEGGAVAGRVVGPDARFSRPRPLSVVVTPLDGLGLLRDVKCDREGRFRTAGLAPGRCRVEIPDACLVREVTVAEGRTETVDFTLPTGGGSVVLTGAQPKSIRAQVYRGTFDPRVPLDAIARSRGRYEDFLLEDVPPGPAGVCLGFSVPTSDDEASPEVVTVWRDGLTIAPGGRVEVAIPDLRSAKGSLEGRVSKKKRSSRCHVFALGEGLLLEAQCDARGAFKLPFVPEGKYRVALGTGSDSTRAAWDAAIEVVVESGRPNPPLSLVEPVAKRAGE